MIDAVAESQGSVTGIDLSPSSEGRRGKLTVGEPFVQPRHGALSILFLLLSMVYFGHALSELFEKDRSKNSDHKSKNNLKESLMVRSRSRDEKKNSGSKSVVSTAAVTNASRKTKKEQKQKKSILKKSSKNFDDDNSRSEESTHYSKFQL